jgi:hypothetical protein
VRARLEEWVYENPWSWAGVQAVVFGIIGFAVFGTAVGIAVAVVAFIALGWGASRGPARKSLERRVHRRRNATDESPD